MIGATTSQSLDLTLLNKGDMVYGTSTIKVEIGLKIGNAIEYIPMGIYNIDDIEKTDYTIKITAFDNMIKFESPYFSSLGDKATLQQVVNELAAKTGVQFTGTVPAYTVKKLEGFSCREVLGYVASICGGNAVITRDGKFTIVTPKDINYSIGTSNYFDYKREETKYKIGKISCQVGEKVLSKGSLGANSMELEFKNPWVTDSILQNIYNKLNGFEYLGYSMKWQGDLSLDVGDIATITDKKGVVRKHPILSQKFTYTGGLTSEIEAKGENKNKNSFSSSGSTANKVDRIVTELAIVNKALIDVAYIGDLTAGNIKFDTASGTIMDLQTLLAKFVTGENGQFLNLTTDNVVIANAVIKDAMIENISVNKLLAGNISTNKFRIVSDDGGIEIVGATQQFKDKNNKVRIQMGQDTQGNFNFILRGEDGATILIDHNGIKEKAIADDLIKSNMVAEGAIGEKQINYSSLITGFNKDTNTSKIQASKVAIDLTGQSLEVAFNNIKSNVDGINSTVESNTTAISIAQGKIDGLIKESSITKGDITTLKDNYTSIKATVDGINTTVASHTSSIGNLTSNLNGVSGKITTVENKQSTLEQNLNGFKTTVSSTYATKTALSTANSSISSLQTRMSSAESKITDSAIVNTVRSSTSYLSDLNSKANTTDVSKIYATKSSLAQTSENIIAKFSVSGGANLLINSSFEDGISSWSKYSSKGDFKGTVVDAGGFNKPSFKTVKIEMSNYTGIGGYNQYVNVNPNSTYTLSGYIRVYSLTSLTGRSIGISVSEYDDTEATGNSWLAEFQDTKINTSLWRRVSITFTTSNTAKKVQVFFRITNVSQATVYFDNLKMEKGSVLTDWTASNNELIEGNTKINKDGVTIYNGALTIQNKAGKNVLKADNDGNLELGGIFRTYSSSDNKSVEIIRESINLYDWVGSGREEPTGKLYSGRYNNDNLKPTITLANDYCSMITLASRNVNTNSLTYYMLFDKFKIDTENYHPINFKENADLRGNSLYLNQNKAGRIYGTSSNCMMLSIGENSGQGLAIYGKDGNTQFVRIEKTYDYPFTVFQRARFTSDLRIEGALLTNTTYSSEGITYDSNAINTLKVASEKELLDVTEYLNTDLVEINVNGEAYINQTAFIRMLTNKNKLLEQKNEKLEATNDEQDELIDITLSATDEMFMMLEPLLAEMLVNEKSSSKIVDMYVAMVQRGIKTIEQAPVRYREQVKEILAQLEK